MSTASAASLTTSDSVGWAWQVRARSSALAENSIATAASAISSDTRGPTHVDAEDPVGLFVGEDLHHPVLLTEALGASIGPEHEAAARKRDPSILELGLGAPDHRQLGLGVDHVGDDLVVDMPRQTRQVFGDGDALLLRLVREHRAAHQIADRENPLDVGSEVVIDRDPAGFVESDAHILETGAFGQLAAGRPPPAPCRS